MRTTIKRALIPIFLIAACLQAATVSGKVFSIQPGANITGSEPVVGGASVYLLDSNGIADTTTSDAQGHFTFANVALGYYAITADKDGFNCEDCAQSGTVAHASDQFTTNVGVVSDGQASLRPVVASSAVRLHLEGGNAIFAPSDRARTLEGFSLSGVRVFAMAVPGGADRVGLPARAGGAQPLGLRLVGE